MKITFNTKAESKKIQEIEFLKLLPVNRFYRFLNLSEYFSKFPTTRREDTKEVFQIIIDAK